MLLFLYLLGRLMLYPCVWVPYFGLAIKLGTLKKGYGMSLEVGWSGVCVGHPCGLMLHSLRHKPFPTTTLHFEPSTAKSSNPSSQP